MAGIALNFALAAAKITLGAVTGLVSVLADGVNNLSDCGSGIVSLVSFRIAQKPADKEHPYGHQRAEYVASMLISFLVLLLAVEFFRESLERVIADTPSQGPFYLYILLGVSVAVKAGMSLYYRAVAKKIGSDTLKAAGVDSACDCLATLAVIAGLAVSRFVSVPADGYAGVVVALFIAWEGLSLLREAGSKLLGQAPDPALVSRIRAIILGGEGVLGVHDLRVYRYGRDRFYATAHIEADAREPALLSHEHIDAAEREVLRLTGMELTAHFDPVDPDDAEARELEARIRAATEGMYGEMDLHDFRLVRGAKKKIVFEVGVPFDCKAKDGEIASAVCCAVRLLGDYEPCVTVERE